MTRPSRKQQPTPRQEQILEQLGRKGELTTDDIANRLRENRDTIAKDMTSLARMRRVIIAARKSEIMIWRKV